MSRERGTTNVSVRMDSETVARIRARAQARGERLSDAVRRYVEEGERAETHPGVIFRSGPTGRRAGLAGGPDVWEIVSALRQQEPEALAEQVSLTVDRIEVALRYAAEYPDEIEDRIKLHELETAHYDSIST